MLADDGVALCVRNMEAIFGGEGVPEDLAAAAQSAARAPLPGGVAGFARIIAQG